MFNLIAKQEQLPKVRAPLGPSVSDTFWGGLEEMDRMFDQLFHGFDQTLGATVWRAPLAVWEDQEKYHVEIELAGVPRDAVEVTAQKRQLSISYERKVPEGRQFILNERPYGRFERRLALPDGVDADSINAEMRDGVLHIAMSKSPETQPRKITVQSR